MNHGKRKFLKAGAMFIAGAIAGGPLGTLGDKTLDAASGGRWVTLFGPKNVGEVELDAWKVLFNESTPPGLYPGKGNPLGILDNGIQKLSSYLENSSSSFSSYITKAMNLKCEFCKNNNYDEFNYSERKNALFLGGPVANDIVKDLLGYTDIVVIRNGETVKMPKPVMSNKKIRWSQLHGIEGYGIYNGKTETAKRYDEKKLVDRAVYKLIDKNDSSIITPSIDRNGFIENEWLTIVKLKELNTTKVIIGGMHGYSTEAFSSDITKNLEQLDKLTNKFNQYQIIIPVNLTHDTNLLGKPFTFGELNWEGAKVQEIGV